MYGSVMLDGRRETEDRDIRPPSSVLRPMSMSDVQGELVLAMLLRTVAIQRIWQPPLLENLQRVGLVIAGVVAEGQLLQKRDDRGLLLRGERGKARWLSIRWPQ